MNILVQYVLMFGVAGTFFGLLLAAAAEQVGVQRDADSVQEEMRARQLGEHIRLVDMVSAYDPATTPASRMSLDIMSTGPTPISVRHVLVDGVPDRGALLQVVPNGTASTLTALANGTDSWPLPRGQIIRINATEPGGLLILITDNDKAFRFGS